MTNFRQIKWYLMILLAVSTFLLSFLIQIPLTGFESSNDLLASLTQPVGYFMILGLIPSLGFLLAGGMADNTNKKKAQFLSIGIGILIGSLLFLWFYWNMNYHFGSNIH